MNPMFKKIAEGDIYVTDRADYVNYGSRTAKLPDGRLICVFNAESRSPVNDWLPMVCWSDDGTCWSEPEPLWPELIGKESLYVSVRETGDGRICIAGVGYEVAYEGELWWSDELGAIKENYLVYSISDDGVHFPAPTQVALPYYAGAENPGGMLIDPDGTMHFLYSPYPTIEQRAETDTNCMVYMKSTDGGKTFTSKKIAQVEGKCQYAESWIVRLSDGKLLVGTWQTASTEASDQYLVSADNGETFTEIAPMPFRGQSTAITPWHDGAALITYNQRKEQPVGVWLAAAKPDLTGFHMFANEPVWQAASTTRSNSSGDFADWTDFSFGEPQVTVLNNGDLLTCLWYEQNGKKGIRYVVSRYEG